MYNIHVHVDACMQSVCRPVFLYSHYYGDTLVVSLSYAFCVAGTNILLPRLISVDGGCLLGKLSYAPGSMVVYAEHA